jgi:hypothetical protein
MKTINGSSILGNGNLTVGGGSFSGDMDDIPDGTVYVKTENNYTDADAAKVAATSGTNTGDETTSSIQTKRPLKTVNGTSLEGAGNVVISGGISMGDVYPVGSVYISVVSTNPATLLGVGTWAAFATGRTLVGIDAGQTEFDTVEETGGAKTHTLTSSEMPSHTHTITDPGHTHTQTTSATDGASGRADASSGGTIYNNVANINSNTTGITINNTGGGGAHNNLQPYIVVYIWKRTA